MGKMETVDRVKTYLSGQDWHFFWGPKRLGEAI